MDERTGEGVGDDGNSWGFDGSRKMKWHAGCQPWNCSWSASDVIGLAANVDVGKIAISKNGVWTEPPLGVMFESESIKEGVYPCLTGGGIKLRYNLDAAVHGAFKHAPPPSDIWDRAPPCA